MELDNGIPFTLRFRQVKRFRISVKPDGSVEAVSPRGLSLKAAAALADRYSGWVSERREEFISRAAAAPKYVSGESVPLWGRACPLIVVTGPPGAGFDGETITLSVPEGASFESRRGELLALYRRELERAVPPLIEKYASALGVPPPAWSLRDMRSRWGSCTSARGTVRFALGLAAKPPLCLEYVVAHELTHLRIHGHGSDFHALVRSVFPRESEARALLRRL